MKNNNLQKGFSMPIIIAIVALVVIIAGSGYFYVQKQSQESIKLQEQEKALMEKEAMEKKESETMMEKKEGETMMEKENEAMMVKYKGVVLAGKSAPLLVFTKSDYDSAVASDKLVVLYFYANWCPICKAEFPKMQEAFNEITSDKVVGFRINYNDNQTDNDEKNLAREFGVAYQHTKVFLKNGERILKSPESWSKDRYLSEINKYK